MKEIFFETMVNIHCKCHKLTLACADAGNKFKFIRNFDKKLNEQRKSIKKSLKLYIKADLNTTGIDLLPNKRKNMSQK